MKSKIEEKIASMGILIPEAPRPVANYVGCVRSGNLLFVSGQVCLGVDGKLVSKGKLGVDVAIEDGKKAAQACGINLLAQVKAEIGNLDKVVRVVRLGGFVNAAPDYLELPQVMNGVSDLMVAVFGEAGKHARSTIGVASLPFDAAVEVEAVFEITQA